MFWGGLVLVGPGLGPDAPQLFEFVPIVEDFTCACHGGKGHVVAEAEVHLGTVGLAGRVPVAGDDEVDVPSSVTSWTVSGREIMVPSAVRVVSMAKRDLLTRSMTICRWSVMAALSSSVVAGVCDVIGVVGLSFGHASLLRAAARRPQRVSLCTTGGTLSCGACQVVCVNGWV